MTLRQCRIGSQYYCLTTGQRDQTIKFLNLECLKVFNDRANLFIPDKLKTPRPGHHLPPLGLKAYKDVELCVVSQLRQYIKAVQKILEKVMTSNCC